MRNQQQTAPFIIVNKKIEPASIENKFLREYSRFILIDEDLEQMNELALYLEEHGKTVYIIREIYELEKVFEKEGISLSDKAIKGSLVNKSIFHVV